MKNQKPICVDLDGMGDFSRFPFPEKKEKKSLVVSNFFRIFVSNKWKNTTKNSVF
jgi:hypothetical protein